MPWGKEKLPNGVHQRSLSLRMWFNKLAYVGINPTVM